MAPEIVLDDDGGIAVLGSWLLASCFLAMLQVAESGIEEGSFVLGHGFSHAANEAIETPALAAGETLTYSG
jgi:hypothetical protein